MSNEIDWKQEAIIEEAESWGSPNESLVQNHIKNITKGVSLTKEQYFKYKELDSDGVHLSAYNEETEDHSGPIHLDMNMNDTFMYASGWATTVPEDKVDLVLEMCAEKNWNGLTALAALIEKLPPLMEHVIDIEKEGAIPKEITNQWRQMHIDRGTIDDRW